MEAPPLAVRITLHNLVFGAGTTRKFNAVLFWVAENKFQRTKTMAA